MVAKIRALLPQEQEDIITLLLEWISQEMNDFTPLPATASKTSQTGQNQKHSEQLDLFA